MSLDVRDFVNGKLLCVLWILNGAGILNSASDQNLTRH